MIGVIRPAKYIAPFAHPIGLAEPFGAGLLIMMRRAQAGERIERRERLRRRSRFPAVFRDRDPVIYYLRGLDFAGLETGFTTRIHGELQPPKSFPAPRRIRPNVHANSL